MASKTFEDSSGAVWEVFEVRRSSTNPGAVSGGLEQGWLAFVSGDAKRRLAPVPGEWESAPTPELERLCALARGVPAARHRFDATTVERRRRERDAGVAQDTGERRRAADNAATELRTELELAGVASNPAEGDGVEATVRRFAHLARTRGQPAVAAMVELKALLRETFPAPDSEARETRRVRRWFVETYYFERNA
jgi:hypothetical protein